MFRLLAIILALSTLLTLTGLLDYVYCAGNHGNEAGEPTACACICHMSVSELPGPPVLTTSCVPPHVIHLVDDDRRPQDAFIAIDPPPDKRVG